MAKTLHLWEFLQNISTFPWNHALFVEGDRPYDRTRRCGVFDPMDSDDPDEDPPAAKALGLTYALGVEDTRSVIQNAKQQKPAASPDELIRALSFYLDHDAFIDFSEL